MGSLLPNLLVAPSGQRLRAPSCPRKKKFSSGSPVSQIVGRSLPDICASGVGIELFGVEKV